MSLVVVGGQSRSVGKTSAVCSLIAALPERRWTALKITQYGHGICSKDGKPCECAVDDAAHPFAVNRERDREGSTDTSRYLRAGAAEAWWVRAPVGRLDLAKPWLEEVIGAEETVIAESNSLLDLFDADAYLTLWDGAINDVKQSAQRHVGEADAVLFQHKPETLEDRLQRAVRGIERLPADEISSKGSGPSQSPLETGRHRCGATAPSPEIPRFRVAPPDYITSEVIELVRARLGSAP